MSKILMTLLMCLPLTACYYLQAAKGQMEVVRKRQPIDELVKDASTDPRLVERLELLLEARDFSVDALSLPDNSSYRSYADLERDYVVWNVFAAPEFSLQPKQWCFPVAGCVSYRGYFSEEAAMKQSARLADDGYDVFVGGIAAYSTLGKFSDPILSTMMRWRDTDLVALLFHELAHQVIYVKDDSAFNESFATAVEEFGIEHWLSSRGETEKITDYHADRALRRRLLTHVENTRALLEELYASDIDIAARREQKTRHLQSLAHEVDAELSAAGRDSSAWTTGELNNARLISSALYYGYLPSFRIVRDECAGDMPCFYAAVERLADLDPAERADLLTSGDLLRIRQALHQH